MKGNPWYVLIIGLLIRFAIAPITGHPYDMELWASYQRVFFSSGTLDFRYFPTLPLIFFFQLGPYSLYVAARNLGLQDYLLFYHSTYVIESFFLKLPMILADAGVFIVLVRIGKTLPAILYFLNPFMIYLSASWGMYDSVMIFFLVLGLSFLESDKPTLAAIAFTVSGLVKLFGFVPLGLLIMEGIVRRRFRWVSSQVAISITLIAVTFAPVILQGGLPTFVSGFSRLVGTSSAEETGWNLIFILGGTFLPRVPLYVWVAYAAIPIVFIFAIRKTNLLFLAVLQTTLVGAILLNIFSQAEPQWLSWLIPLSLIYASVTKRPGLTYYSFSFGSFATFLAMTLTQGTSYLLFGTLGANYLSPLEGFSGAVFVYAVVVLASLLVLCGYVLAKPVKFRVEILLLILVIYAQAYLWSYASADHHL